MKAKAEPIEEQKQEPGPERRAPTKIFDAITKQAKTLVAFGVPGSGNVQVTVALTGHMPTQAEVDRAYLRAEKAYEELNKKGKK